MLEEELVDELPPGSFQPIASSWCHSVGEIVKIDFQWTIHQYELVKGPWNRLASTTFSVSDKEIVVTTWNLLLDDDGVLLNQIYPPVGDSLTISRCIRVSTALLNSKRNKVFCGEIIVAQGTPMPTLVNRIPKEFLIDQSNDLLVNGALTIYCEVEMYKGEKNLKGQGTQAVNKPISHKDELCEGFSGLFESMQYSDVIINVPGQQFTAHKAILAARSPVFAAMLKPSSKEYLTGIVDVVDIEANVFKELLRYIYTGQVPLEKMDEVAAWLLVAADKYLLEKLKKACGDYLINRISPENCFELLSLCEFDSAYYLREKAEDFCRQFPCEVIKTANWKRAKEENPEWFKKIENMVLDSLAQQLRAKK